MIRDNAVLENLTGINEKLMTNPEQYGFCTFEDFRKNKDKWRVRPDQLLHSVDNSSAQHKMIIKEQRYYLEGYRCDSLEKVEDLASVMGIAYRDLKIGGIVREKTDNGKQILHVHFMSQETIDRRKTW